MTTPLLVLFVLIMTASIIGGAYIVYSLFAYVIDNVTERTKLMMENQYLKRKFS